MSDIYLVGMDGMLSVVGTQTTGQRDASLRFINTPSIGVLRTRSRTFFRAPLYATAKAKAARGQEGNF